MSSRRISLISLGILAYLTNSVIGQVIEYKQAAVEQLVATAVVGGTATHVVSGAGGGTNTWRVFRVWNDGTTDEIRVTFNFLILGCVIDEILCSQQLVGIGGMATTPSTIVSVSSTQAKISDGSGTNSWRIFRFFSNGRIDEVLADFSPLTAGCVIAGTCLQEVISGNCDSDANGDGEVNVTDLLDLLAAWGQCPQNSMPVISSSTTQVIGGNGGNGVASWRTIRVYEDGRMDQFVVAFNGNEGCDIASSACIATEILPSSCGPDGNWDGDVDTTDLLALLAAWGTCP